ncbi:MAG: hydroxyisourate hydrolase [Pseudomonadota bacterium]
MAKGYLTTHVLDTALGQPAAGIKIRLFSISGDSHQQIAEAVTNADGRTDAPILETKSFKTGTYELIFEAGAYLDDHKASPETPRFLETIPIRFGISDADSHYHVPLLLSPFGYTTYRGS